MPSSAVKTRFAATDVIPRAVNAHHAPVALFAFKRPAHTRRALEALARNPELGDSALHVFCDAARRVEDEEAVEQTRQTVRDFAHPRKVVVEASANQGLARSIIAGVTELCRASGRVIVLEDDLLVAPTFLDYMNRALTRYETEARVMQVSGHMFPVALASNTDSVLLPFTTSWGWAVWERSWRRFDAQASGRERLQTSLGQRYRFDLDGSFPYFDMLRQQLSGVTDSWAIRWYLSVFLDAGQVLFPTRSLVENIGFDGSGTHCDDRDLPAGNGLSDAILSVETTSPAADAAAFQTIKTHLRRDRGLMKRIGDWKQRLVAG